MLSRFSLRRTELFLAALVLLWPMVQALRAAETGEQIYVAKCAACHGASGEGTKKTENKPLRGEHSLAQLAKVIRETMPEDKPNTLTAAEADAVAAFVHGKFYSAIAQERNRAARVELARLTVKQYRQSVADLVGSFRSPMRWGEKRGLKAEYYKGKRVNQGSRDTERVDANVDFNFGVDAPEGTKLEAAEFTIRWTGSVLVPETGEYELVLRTEHAARLWVNDLKDPLIDRWVKSGKDTEYRETIFLVAGRVYPLRLEYSKGKQGVDDKKKEAKPTKSSMVLAWKRPHGEVEPIPSRQLSPDSGPEQYLCTQAFPPDDRSYGWERGTTVSKEWEQATTEAAIDVVGYLLPRLNEFASTSEKAGDRADKLKEFCRRFAERAFRRPLADEQKQLLIDKQFAAAATPEIGVKRSVILTLKSPGFLYREVAGGNDAFDTAARLSFGLWDSLPDEKLRTAAAEGKLGTHDEIVAHVERMLADPRGQAKLRDFLITWLKADQPHDLSKNKEQFPGFDAEVIGDLRTSLAIFLDDMIASPEADFRRLLLAEEVPLNGRLGKFYGVDPALLLPPRDPDKPHVWGERLVSSNTVFVPVKLDADRRAGVLTHPYLMASFAHYGESSPIHRGVFLARGMFGVGLRPPPEAVAPLSPDLHPDLTTRERVIMQTKNAVCMTCHGVINPLGFTLENFDAVGRFREIDRGKPIDASGEYLARDGKRLSIRSARELAKHLAESEEAHEAFVEQMLHHLVQQPAQAYGPTTLDTLRGRFAASGFNLKKLAAEIMAVTAPVGRK